MSNLFLNVSKIYDSVSFSSLAKHTDFNYWANGVQWAITNNGSFDSSTNGFTLSTGDSGALRCYKITNGDHSLIWEMDTTVFNTELPRNTTYTTQGSIHLYVLGKIGCIQIANVVKTNTERTPVATLPTKYKPIIQWYGLFSPYPNAGNFIIESGTGEIKTEGTTTRQYGCVVFPIA